jgi:hypothetical protein
MKKLLSLLLASCLLTPAFADEYSELSHQYNLVYQEFLREKILKLPKHAIVELSLNDETVVRGTYDGYSKYDDSFWILPLGKRGLFVDDAYDIGEIQDVRVIVLRGI